MKYEPTLPKNPYQLTIRQHVFPRSAIQRFADEEGSVEVHLFEGDKRFRVKPTNAVFCAHRVWDQAAETLQSEPIEGPYAALADQIASGQVETLTPAMDRVVSAFFLLWNHRHGAMAKLSNEDVTLTSMPEEFALTKEQEEILEKKGVMFVRGNKFPSRFLNRLTIQRENDRGMLKMADTKWGVLRAAQGEFLVPDNTAELGVVPVSPTLCLAAGLPDGVLSQCQVGHVNSQLRAGARSYLFARNLAMCPIANGT